MPTKGYWAVTPKRFRIAGDTILVGCASLSTAVMGMPLSDVQIKWTMFVINLVGVAGKIMTNFAKDEDSTCGDKSNDTPETK